jgi:hypothetical protein
MYIVKRKDTYACTAPPGTVQAPHWGFEWKPVSFIDGAAGTYGAPANLMTWQTKQGAKRFARMNGGKAKSLAIAIEKAKAAYLEPLSNYKPKPESVPWKPRNTLYGLLSA